MKVYIVYDEKHNNNRVYMEEDLAEGFCYFCDIVRQTFKEMGSKYCTEINGERQAFDDNGRNAEQAIEYKSTVFGGRKIAFEEGELIDLNRCNDGKISVSADFEEFKRMCHH